MISSIVALAAVLPSTLSSAEAERVYTRLCETPTAQSSRQEHPLIIKPTTREEVALSYPNGVTISEGFLRSHSEPEVAWALACHLGARVRFVAGGQSNNRIGLQIYKEAGYDPFLPAANAPRQSDYLRRISPDWQLGAFALELTYGPAADTSFRDPEYGPTPTTGTVELTWRYDDPAWTDWFARETGRPAPVRENRFAAGQCTALAYAIRPDFPFDTRGGGRNDAKNWLALAKAAGWPISSLPTYLSIGVQDAWAGNPAGHVFVCLGQTADGKIRAIDSNFGKQPDGQVRVRTFLPDKKIIGYIAVPTIKRYEGEFGSPLRPNQTTITAERPYWHAAFDGRVMFRSRYPESWWLSFRMRSLEGRQHDIKLWLATSIGETKTVNMTIEPEWDIYEIGPISSDGGGDSISPHIVHSLMLGFRSASGELAPCEIADPHVIMRGPS